MTTMIKPLAYKKKLKLFLINNLSYINNINNATS